MNHLDGRYDNQQPAQFSVTVTLLDQKVDFKDMHIFMRLHLIPNTLHIHVSKRIASYQLCQQETSNTVTTL